MEDYVIVGVDPGMGASKPMAVVALVFSSGKVRVLYADTSREVLKSWGIVEKLLQWLVTIREAVYFAQGIAPVNVYIATEDARGVGGSGYAIQALVRAIRDMADDGYYVCKPINPRTVKAITGDGHASAEDLARFVHMTVEGVDVFPKTKDYDWESAVGVGLAADGCEVRERQLEASTIEEDVVNAGTA